MKISKLFVLPLSIMLIMAIALSGCTQSAPTPAPVPNPAPSPTPSPAPAPVELSGAMDITGSNTVTPVTTLFAEEFMTLHPKVNISVAGPGSGAGIAAIINKTTDICQSSRPIKQSEIDQGKANGVNIREIRIATDAIAVIVHPSNPLSSLTIEQLSGIYTGAITNWSQVGGNNAPIVALSRDTNSGTHVYFKEAIVQMDGLPTKDTSLEYGCSVQFLPSTSTGVTQIIQNPNAIFYIGLGYMDSKVKALGIKKTAGDAPVLPSLETALNNTYPIARGLFYYIDGEPAGLIKAFTDFALSAKGQELVVKSGFVPLK